MKSTFALINTVALLLFSGCSTSTLTYDNSNLNLRVDNTILKVHGEEIKSHRENYSILFLEQKLIRLDDGSIVMYEYAQTDMAYEFAQITTRAIDIIFDARSIVKVYDKALIYGYQIILKDGRVLNAVVSQSFGEELTMVYGMSSQKFDEMLKKIDPNAKPVPYRNAVILKNEPNPLMSRWNTWKINFVPLVQPLPRLQRM